MVYSQSQDIKNDWKNSIYTFFGVLVFWGVSAGFLTIGRGVQSDAFVKQFNLYFILGLIGLLFIVGVDSYNFVTKTRVLKAILFDPEDSILASSKLKIVYNPLLQFLFFLIIFLPLTYISARVKNLFFSAIPQQIASSSLVWADSAFPAISETLIFAFVYSLVNSPLERKFKKSNPVLYWFLMLSFVPLAFGLLWMWFHNAVYSSDAIAMQSVFVFGFVGTFLTMAFKSLIPFATIHFCTNLMLSLKTHGWFANDLTSFMIVLIELFSILLFIYVWKSLNVNRSGSSYG